MFSDKLRFIYLSLPFFDKSEEECESCFATEQFVYQNINGYYWEINMFKSKKNTNGLNIIIVGCGKVGLTLIEQLTKEGHDITVIDRKPSLTLSIMLLWCYSHQ